MNKPRIRLALANRQGGFLCFYCGRALQEPPTETMSMERSALKGIYYATIDHVKPRSAGGTSDLRNMVLACSPCHVARHIGE